MNTNKKEKFINKNNAVHKRFWQIGIRTFFVFLFVIAFIGLLLPLRPKESELEKRELSKFPKPTVSTVLNGEFFSDISTWYADTFPFRETLMSANAKMKKFYGITTQEIYGDAAQGDEIPDADAEMETTPTPTPEEDDIQEEDGTIHAEPERLGKIYIADNRGFELYGFSRAGADAYINMMNSAATQLKDIATIYDILVPTSIAVNIDQENQQKVGSNSQEDTFAYVNGHLDASINQVAVLDALKNHNSEYLYFKTDHHWTADGAYYAYKELMKAKGMTPSPLTDFTKISANGSYWENGHWVETEPMEIKREYNFPQVGEKDMYLLHHEEIESLAKNVPGVKRIRFFMTFGQSYLTHMKCLENVGMLSTSPINYEGREIVPIQFLKALLPDPASLGPRTVGKTNIGCIFTGKKDGKEKTIYIYNVCDHQECYKEVGSQAISYTTGVPAMIGAALVVDKVWDKDGVFNIEEFDPDPFMDMLNQYGLPWVVDEDPQIVE